MDAERIESLAGQVETSPIALLRIERDEWEAIRSSRHGVAEFTLPVLRTDLAGLRTPTLCIVIADRRDGEQLLIAVVNRPSAIATVHSRLRLTRVFPLEPSTPDAIAVLLDQHPRARSLVERFGRRSRITLLTPKLSADLVRALAGIAANEGGLAAIGSTIAAPRRVRGNAAFEDMSLRTALRTFGLAPDEPADLVEVRREDETVLSRVARRDDFSDFPRRMPLTEDAVIEHDARWILGLHLSESDVTGRAVFTRGNERLEVLTANRRGLEHALGVDLIYFNETRGNVVMVQYKMLEPRGGSGWTYRPDDQLRLEIERMRAFQCSDGAHADEYRLNPGIFYLKFVKRDAALRQGGIVMPLDHYEAFATSADARGPRGGLRIDYDALKGRYLREQPFVDLVRAGYIGAYERDAAAMREIVHQIVERGGAVVTAIQSAARDRRR